jgi:hypothetical protein
LLTGFPAGFVRGPDLTTWRPLSTNDLRSSGMIESFWSPALAILCAFAALTGKSWFVADVPIAQTSTPSSYRILRIA